MNKFSLFVVILLSLTIAGCGGKKGGGSGSSGVFTNALSTQEGTLDSRGNFIVGSTTYVIDPSSYQVIDQAIRASGQPAGLQSYRARLTATISGQQQGYPNQPGQPMYPPTYGGMGQRLLVQTAVIY